MSLNEMTSDKQYRQWLIDIKQRIRNAQIKAAVAVNSALVEFYGSLGADIVQKQEQAAWGSGFLQQLSKDLMAEFPKMKRLSLRNLKFIRQWYLFYSQVYTIGKQLASQLARIPWWHNIVIIQKCDTVKKALFYVQKTVEHNWSRSVLVHQIEAELEMMEARNGK